MSDGILSKNFKTLYQPRTNAGVDPDTADTRTVFTIPSDVTMHSILSCLVISNFFLNSFCKGLVVNLHSTNYRTFLATLKIFCYSIIAIY